MAERVRILDGASFRLIAAPKRKVILRQGDPAEAIYRVERGCVRLQIETEDGRREVVAFLFAGDVFCVGMETHWASAYAVTDAVVARYSISSLWELMSRDSRAAKDLMASADELLHEMAHHLVLLSHSSARARLVWFLQWLSVRTGGSVDGALEVPMSRRDIADFLGLAPETVSRLFRRLEEQGEVLRNPGRRGLLMPPARKVLVAQLSAARAGRRF